MIVQKLIKQALPFLVGIDNIYLMQESKHDQGNVAASISTTIHPENTQKFLDWQTRITPIQSKFPGFIGCKLEKSKQPDTFITTVTFDSDEHLQSWLESNERKRLVDESNSFSTQNNIEKIYSGFDFWFNKTNAPYHSVWKENMLVLLTLYRVVFFLSYIQNYLMKNGIPFWLALFFGNAASTAILGWITVYMAMEILLVDKS